jgi:hypothetical protein
VLTARHIDLPGKIKRRDRPAARGQITAWEMDHHLQLYQSRVGSE